jgi:aspartate 1-decarboxylase
MSYCQIDSTEAKDHKPKVVFVDKKNKITEIGNSEKHGEIK